MNLGIPPLESKKRLESNPLESTFLVCGLAVLECTCGARPKVCDYVLHPEEHMHGTFPTPRIPSRKNNSQEHAKTAGKMTNSQIPLRKVNSQVRKVRIWKLSFANATIGWVSEWWSEWVSDWVTEWVTERLSDRVTQWLNDWVTEWLSDWVTEWLRRWDAETLRRWDAEMLRPSTGETSLL